MQTLSQHSLMRPIVAVSGGMDPLHIGHLEMIQKARELGRCLVVILNNDNWLRQKKGYVFMLQNDREQILRALKYVDEVIITSHKPTQTDMSVCKELRQIHPDIFAKGGDRTSDNTPEAKLCAELGIKVVYGLGDKIRASSDLVKEAAAVLTHMSR